MVLVNVLSKVILELLRGSYIFRSRSGNSMSSFLKIEGSSRGAIAGKHLSLGVSFSLLLWKMLPRGVNMWCFGFLRLELTFFQKLGENGEISGRFWQVVRKGEKSFILSITEKGVREFLDILSSWNLFGVITIDCCFSLNENTLCGSSSLVFIANDQTKGSGSFWLKPKERSKLFELLA